MGSVIESEDAKKWYQSTILKWVAASIVVILVLWYASRFAEGYVGRTVADVPGWDLESALDRIRAKQERALQEIALSDSPLFQ